MNTPAHGYSVRAVKAFMGREGHGFNAALYHHDRKVAEVHDMADGGALRFYWTAPTAEERAAEAKALDALCATLPKWKPADVGIGGCEGAEYPMDADLFVTRLVEDHSIRAKMKRKLGKQIMLLQDGTLSHYPAKVKPTAANLEAAQKKHTGATLLNLLPTEEALDRIMETVK